jgi:hypothetical protein
MLPSLVAARGSSSNDEAWVTNAVLRRRLYSLTWADSIRVDQFEGGSVGTGGVYNDPEDH